MAFPVIASSQASDSGGSAVSSLNCTLPSGAVEGSFVIIIVGQDETAAVTFSATSYVEEINESVGGQVDAALGILSGNVTATNASDGYITVSSTGDDEMWAAVLRITGADETDPIEGTPGQNNTAATTTHTFDTTSTSVNECLIIAALSFDGGDGNPFVVDTGVSAAAWDGATVNNITSGVTGNDAGGCWLQRNLATAGSSEALALTSSASDGSVHAVFAIKEKATSPTEGSSAGAGAATGITDEIIIASTGSSAGAASLSGDSANYSITVGESDGVAVVYGVGSDATHWTFDANQMTFDDNTNHTMDGWHSHVAGATSLVYRPNKHFLHTILR